MFGGRTFEPQGEDGWWTTTVIMALKDPVASLSSALLFSALPSLEGVITA